MTQTPPPASKYDDLSDRQKAILKFIEDWSNANGFPPTIRGIGQAVGINSTSVVNYNLNKLAKEGFLTRSQKTSRGIRLVKAEVPAPTSKRSRAQERDMNAHAVPLLGLVAAGYPIEVREDITAGSEDTIDVPRHLLGSVDPSQVFALRVQGLSMIDSMINDGDIVVFRRQETARNGEMVAVWLTERGETTLKHFFDEGNQVRLQPANPTMSPFYVDKDKVQVQGRVLAVLRRVQ